MRGSGPTRALIGTAASVLLASTLVACGGGETSGNDPSGESTASSAVDEPTSSSTADTTSSQAYPAWESFNTVEIPRDDFGTSLVGTDIWIMGGMTGERGNRLTSIEVLDTQTGEWTMSNIEMPVGLASFESAAIGSKIYVFGGFDVDYQASDFAGVLDTTTGTWTELPPLPHARYAHTVTEHEGELYVVGGEGNRSQQVAAIDIFEPEQGTWRTSDVPLPGPRNSHDTLSVPQGLLVIGGFDEEGQQDRVDLFDPTTGSSTEVPDLPRPISRGGAAVIDDQAWFSWHEQTYVLDLADLGEWQEGNPLTRSRHGLGYVPVGDWLYAIAGCSENPLRDVRTVDRMPIA